MVNIGLLLVLLPVALALPFSSNTSSKVWDVQSYQDFLRLSKADNEMFVVLFYDSRDLNSFKAANVWEQVAERLEGFATTAGVDVSNLQSQFLVNSWNIQAVPMVRIVPPEFMSRGHSDVRLSPYSGIKKIGDYQNHFKAEEIRKAVLRALTSNYITKPKDTKEFESFQPSNPALSKVVLLTNKDQTTDLYKALSIRFRQRLDFFEANVNKPFGKDLKKTHSIQNVPALLILPSGTLFKGTSFSINELSAFLEPHALPVADAEAFRLTEFNKVLSSMKDRAEKGVVQITTNDAFQKEIFQRPEISLIAFLDSSAPDHTQRTDTLKQFSLGISTAVKNVVWVNTVESANVMKYFGVESNGIVFVIPKKSRYLVFTGKFTEDSIRQFIEKNLMKGTGSKEYKIEKIPSI
eukprot:PhF_6_TR5162/c0_g1_i1/m.7392